MFLLIHQKLLAEFLWHPELNQKGALEVDKILSLSAQRKSEGSTSRADFSL